MEDAKFVLKLFFFSSLKQCEQKLNIIGYYCKAVILDIFSFS